MWTNEEFEEVVSDSLRSEEIELPTDDGKVSMDTLRSEDVELPDASVVPFERIDS